MIILSCFCFQQDNLDKRTTQVLMANGSRIRISTTSVRGSCKKTFELKHVNLGLKRLKYLEIAEKKQALRMKRIPGLCRDLFCLNAFVHSEGDGRQSVRVHLGLVFSEVGHNTGGNMYPNDVIPMFFPK